MRKAILAAIAIMALAGLTAAAMAAVPTKPVKAFSGLAGPATVRPARLADSTDGSTILGGDSGSPCFRSALTWPTCLHRILWYAGWNRSSVVGLAAQWANDCLPDCADGSYGIVATPSGYPIKTRVTLYRPVRGIFTRMTVNLHYRRVTLIVFAQERRAPVELSASKFTYRLHHGQWVGPPIAPATGWGLPPATPTA